MKRLALLFAGLLTGAVSVLCSTPGQKSQSPLMKPYTPTRLEWLALDLESRFKTQLEGGEISSVDFTAIAPDTIVISILYSTGASAAVVDMWVSRVQFLTFQRNSLRLVAVRCS